MTAHLLTLNVLNFLEPPPPGSPPQMLCSLSIFFSSSVSFFKLFFSFCFLWDSGTLSPAGCQAGATPAGLPPCGSPNIWGSGCVIHTLCSSGTVWELWGPSWLIIQCWAGGRVYGKSVFQPFLPILVCFLSHSRAGCAEGRSRSTRPARHCDGAGSRAVVYLACPRNRPDYHVSPIPPSHALPLYYPTIGLILVFTLFEKQRDCPSLASVDIFLNIYHTTSRFHEH